MLILSTASGYGGAERSIELVAPELGRHTRVLVLAESARHRHNLVAAAARARVGLDVLPLPGSEGRRRIPLALACYVAARLAFRPDVVLANTQHSARLLAWAARLPIEARHRTWLYVRDFTWQGLPGILAALPRAGVLVPGPAVLERAGYLAPWVEPQLPRPLRIVPDMVDVPERPPEAAPVDAANDGYALHLATVNHFKGHTHLIAAAGQLQQTGRAVWVRSRGLTADIALRRQLERQIDAAGLVHPARFELLEHVEDPRADLRGCRCVVVPSVSRGGGPETFGRTIIEAWAHAKPVVAFSAGGARHLITHGEDGLLVPEGDERALAEAVWRVQNEPGLAARLGARGWEKARRDYSLGSVAERLLAVLSEPDTAG